LAGSYAEYQTVHEAVVNKKRDAELLQAAQRFHRDSRVAHQRTLSEFELNPVGLFSPGREQSSQFVDQFGIEQI
jgi:hypothetical protein